MPSQSPQQGPRLKVWFAKDQVGEYEKSNFHGFNFKNKNQHPDHCHWENLVTAFFIHGTKDSRIDHLRKWFSHESQDQKVISSLTLHIFPCKGQGHCSIPSDAGNQVVMFESTFVFVQPGVVDYQDSKNEKVSDFWPFQNWKAMAAARHPFERAQHFKWKASSLGSPDPFVHEELGSLSVAGRSWAAFVRVKFMNSQRWKLLLLLHVITRLWAWQAKLLNIRHCLYYQRLKESCPWKKLPASGETKTIFHHTFFYNFPRLSQYLRRNY